jgi:pyruvate dehydrogenase E2 component (dihydrolipoamide acetyltransferase)
MTDITMPRLSDSMEQGTILTWLKGPGDEIAVGEELVEIETDKATMTHESTAAGALTIVAAVGETVPVGDVIARVGVRDEAAATPAEPPAAPSPLQPTASGAGRPSPPSPSAPAQAPSTVVSTTTNASGVVLATPVARRIADVHGIDLATITGTGVRGRVTRTDVAAAAGLPIVQAPRTPAAPAEPAEPVASGPSANGGGEIRELTRLQRTVVRRMSEAKATVPEFQVQTEVELDALLAFRTTLKEAADDGDVVPSINDLIVKASALALRAHPLANGSYKDGGFELHERINVGIAVAAGDALLVPVVKDADSRSLGSIARRARELAATARDGSITPPELSGGTFTISNLGMFGMTAITPVINVPQAAILGVGSSRAVLARNQDGEIVDRQLMTLTLTCDHRILYGADAARFLGAIRHFLENPLRLTL